MGAGTCSSEPPSLGPRPGRGAAWCWARIGGLTRRAPPATRGGPGACGAVSACAAVTGGGAGCQQSSRRRAPSPRLSARPPARPRVWVGRAPLAEHPSGRAPAPRTCRQLLGARLGAQDQALALAGPAPVCVSSPCRSRARARRCGGRVQSGARPGPARR